MKKIRVHLKRFVAIGITIVIFVLLWSLLRYMLVDDSEGYTRITLHEFYEQEKIDILFMGASHTEVGFNTSIADEMLDANTFNFGSSSQRISLTYLLLEEALERYDIPCVYVDLSYNMATLEPSENMTGTYCITDYLKPSLRKYIYLLSNSHEDNYANSFILARRDFNKVFNINEVVELLKKKSSNEYKEYEYFGTQGSTYAGKGFIEYDKDIDGTYRFGEYKYTNDIIENIKDDWSEYIQKMIKLCEKHNTKLTFISTPVSLYRMKEYGNYDLYIKYIKELIKEESNSVDYIDFNLLKDEYWGDTIDYYYDASHLRKAGSERFSELFCDYIKGNITGDELFYSSIKEKLEDKKPEVYGATYNYEDLNLEDVKCKIVGNKLDELLTRVVLINLDGEEVIKEWSTDSEFYLKKWNEGRVNIEYALSTSPEDVCTLELYFEGLE